MASRGFSVTDKIWSFTTRVSGSLDVPRKALSRNGDQPLVLKKGYTFLICHLDVIDIIVFQQHEGATLK